jgi:uncharacterized protein YecT (DUF1311 family)
MLDRSVRIRGRPSVSILAIPTMPTPPSTVAGPTLIILIRWISSMNPTPVVLITCLLATTTLAQAASPSFNCAKATHDVEKLICNDADLASLDNSLSSLYHTLMKNLSAAEQKLLKTEQRGWVKGRDDCWKSDDMRGCVLSEYQYRINQLKDR